MQTKRYVRLFRNGRNQAIRIPKDFELPGKEAVIIKENESLIIKPVNRLSLLSLLKTLEPIDEVFPDTDEDLLPLNEIKL